MTLLDKAIPVVTPPETDEERGKARAKARVLARDCPWLAEVLQHHVAIEQAFAAVRSAQDASQRRAAQRWLATLLTGHSAAEEAVLYPAIASGEQKQHSMSAYAEQSGAKVNLAALETLDPMSPDYLAKLEHLRKAVAHHVYEEEADWYPGLARHGAADKARLSARFEEEFCRYMGPDADLS
jgi:hypothetical protein